MNAHGALIFLSTPVLPGQKVLVKHKRTQEEQECVVANLGMAHKGSRPQVGLEFTHPNPKFWRVAFPPVDWSPRHPDARAPSI